MVKFVDMGGENRLGSTMTQRGSLMINPIK
jgi:hypothetical protein